MAHDASTNSAMEWAIAFRLSRTEINALFQIGIHAREQLQQITIEQRRRLVYEFGLGRSSMERIDMASKPHPIIYPAMNLEDREDLPKTGGRFKNYG